MNTEPRSADALPEPLRDVLALLERGRGWRYAGEPLSHWDHALQTAALALQARASAALVTAALLHDIGHLEELAVLPTDTPLASDPTPPAAARATPTLLGRDDHHELHGAARLTRLFGAAVGEPVRLHVQAKRYLVAATPSYAARLSADSLRSLALQGGPMDEAEGERFLKRPYAADALRLRAWDDAAKDPDTPPQRLDRFMPALLQAWAERPG